MPVGAGLDSLACQVAFADEEARHVRGAALRVEAREESDFVDGEDIDPHAAVAVVVRAHAGLGQERLGAEHALGFLEGNASARLADADEQEASDHFRAGGRVQARRAAGDPPPLTRDAGEVRGLGADVDRRDHVAFARHRPGRILRRDARHGARRVLRGRLDSGGHQGDRNDTMHSNATTSPCDA